MSPVFALAGMISLPELQGVDPDAPTFRLAVVESALTDAYFGLGDLRQCREHGTRALALFGSTENAAYKVLSVRTEESIVAILAAAMLFLLPTDWAARKFTLGWESAARIDWGTIILFGGGLSLGQLMFTTGLAGHIGSGLVEASGAESLWSITAASIVIAIIMTIMVLELVPPDGAHSRATENDCRDRVRHCFRPSPASLLLPLRKPIDTRPT